MDVLEILKNEHRVIAEIFEKIENSDTSELTQRLHLFQDAEKLMKAHMRAEETAVYSRLQELESTQRQGFRYAQEHGVIDYLIRKLEDISVRETQRWMATFQVLKEIVVHHIEEEEQELFPQIQAHFIDDEREEMAEEMNLHENKAKLPKPRPLGLETSH